MAGSSRPSQVGASSASVAADEISRLELLLADTKSKSQREAQTLHREYRERSTRAFASFTLKNNELIKTNQKLREDAKKWEQKAIQLSQEVKRFEMILRLRQDGTIPSDSHIERGSSSVDESGAENSSPRGNSRAIGELKLTSSSSSSSSSARKPTICTSTVASRHMPGESEGGGKVASRTPLKAIGGADKTTDQRQKKQLFNSRNARQQAKQAKAAAAIRASGAEPWGGVEGGEMNTISEPCGWRSSDTGDDTGDEARIDEGNASSGSEEIGESKKGGPRAGAASAGVGAKCGVEYVGRGGGDVGGEDADDEGCSEGLEKVTMMEVDKEGGQGAVVLPSGAVDDGKDMDVEKSQEGGAIALPAGGVRSKKHPGPAPLTASSYSSDKVTSLLGSQSEGVPRAAVKESSLEGKGGGGDGKDDLESGRKRRRSCVVGIDYKEPSIGSKLRRGDANTFSLGYDTGIKAKTLAEVSREQARRRKSAMTAIVASAAPQARWK